MPWRTIATTDCKLTQLELSALAAIQGANNGLQMRLNDVVGEFIGAMNAVGYPVAALINGQQPVPDILRTHITARATWLFVGDFAALKSLKTEQREKLANKAEEVLTLLSQRKFGAIESPTPQTKPQGNWNSENRVIGRMHPVPPESTQVNFTDPSNPPYANPNAQGDDE